MKNKSKIKTLGYIHTLDGFVATFVKNEQICYAINGYPARLVKSVYQIKKERKMSTEYRLNRGLNDDTKKIRYGYKRVTIEVKPEKASFVESL